MYDIARCILLLQTPVSGIQGHTQAVMIHRDIKSDNALVEDNCRNVVTPLLADLDNWPVLVRLGDAGCARTMSKGPMSQAVGDLIYTPKEEASSQNYDEKADIFRLGLIFFEMWCQVTW